jgi:hypothetical protein
MRKLYAAAAFAAVLAGSAPASAMLPIGPLVGLGNQAVTFAEGLYADLIYGITSGIVMGGNYTFSGALKLPATNMGTPPCPSGDLLNNNNLQILMDFAARNCQATLAFGLQPGPGCSVIAQSPTLRGVCITQGTVNNLSAPQCQALAISCNAIYPGHCTGNCPQQ